MRWRDLSLGHPLPPADRRQSNRDRYSIVLCIGFLVIVFATGGSSRSDEPAQIFNRCAAIIFGATAATRISVADLRRVRMPLFTLTAMALVGALQLIPMPPNLWAMLPGHREFGPIDALSGLGAIWRPLSLSPDMTLNSLLALLPPLAAILLVGSVRPEHQSIIGIALVFLILASAFLGLFQAATGQFHLYGFRVAGFEGANGLLANRNHQAALLACALPIGTAMWIRHRRRFGWLAPVGIAILLVIMAAILATGSRAGFVLAVIAAAATWWMYPNRPATEQHRRHFDWRAWVASCSVCGIGIAIFLFPPTALQRLFHDDLTQEFRLRLFMPLLRIGWQYFPFGAGLGSFVDVYKRHEQLGDLGIQYLNHAHDDLIEMFIECGLAGLAILAVTGAWVGMRARTVWLGKASPDGDHLPQAACIVFIIVLLASLADYPLRTPLVAVIFTIALCWLSPSGPAS